jgi:transcription-repair coupling factor (superfamily II helicase)
VPPQVTELINAVRLRRAARQLGLERIFLREQKFTAYFVSNPESEYFSTPIFSVMLNFVRTHPTQCRMKEHNNKLSLIISKVNNVSAALQLMQPLVTNLESSPVQG